MAVLKATANGLVNITHFGCLQLTSRAIETKLNTKKKKRRKMPLSTQAHTKQAGAEKRGVHVCVCVGDSTNMIIDECETTI